ncbi:mitochondrial cardiolipin hydrolase-like [Aricia agestis]|uniref:mitochondrial cardiolipin hydrolase-like n=1 Tax=Aricia agestis TaxID=91739 RepID=UPI001C20B726|nr:mitochondrial cardiolipin hydrolase-like [Aricia agestis]
MKFSVRALSTAAAFAVACVVSAAAYYYKSRNAEFNEVMVFCKLQYNAYNYFDKLMSFIEKSKRCVNVCMPGIHNPAIQGKLVSLIQKKQIKVRIVIDRSGYNESTEFFIKELIEAGAEIRYKTGEPSFSMQHKFCLVDDKILLTGTLNWGNDRSFDHWNYVYITNKDQLVSPVKCEFYKIWNNSTDIQCACDNSDCDSVVNGNSDEDSNSLNDKSTINVSSENSSSDLKEKSEE